MIGFYGAIKRVSIGEGKIINLLLPKNWFWTLSKLMIFFVTVFLSICRCGVDKWYCKCCLQEHKRSSLPLTSVTMNRKKQNTMEIRDPYRMHMMMLLFAFLMLLTYNLHKICARSRKFICVRFFCNARNRAFLEFGFHDNINFKQLPAVFPKLM